MTPLQTAEKVVTDTHLRLSTLAERRAKISEQLKEAEAEERRLLRNGSDLAELAGARGRISAGGDLLREAAGEIEQLEARLDELEGNVRRETVLEQLSAYAGESAAVEREIGAVLDQIARLIDQPLAQLEALHTRLRAARDGYEEAGRELHPYWNITDQRPRARDEAEGLLRRRGVSLKALNPAGIPRPKDVAGARAAAWSLYGGIAQRAWVAAHVERTKQGRETAAERARARAETERALELVEITAPHSERFLGVLPPNLDRRSFLAEDADGGERSPRIAVLVERRHLEALLSDLQARLSPDDFAALVIDREGRRPAPMPKAPPGTLRKQDAALIRPLPH